MLFTEFNMEDALEVRGEEMFAEGRLAGLADGKLEGLTEGKALSILELLEDIGQVPAVLRETILNQQNQSVLTQWHKLAAKARDIAEFESQIRGT